MRHVKAEFDKLSFKEFILYLLAGISMISGIVAIFIGLFLPPEGEIHPSVISFFGLAAAMCGSLLGINMHYSNKYNELEAKINAHLSNNSKKESECS